MPKILIFQSGKARFAVDPTRVSEIKPVSALGVAPGTQQVHRTIQYQGRALLFIDLAAVLNPGNPDPHPKEAKALMVKPLNGAPEMAIIADSVNGVLDVPAQQINALPPVFTGRARNYFSNVVRLEQRLALVFNPSALVESEAGAHGALQPGEVKPGPGRRPNRAARPLPLQTSSQRTTALHFERLELLIEATLCRMAAQCVQQKVARAMRAVLGAMTPAHEGQGKTPPTKQPRQAAAHAKPAAGHVLIFPARTPGIQGKQVYYLFSLRQVVDVLRQADLLPVPFGPGFAEGVAEWRGRVLPVLSLERCLGMKTSAETLPLRTIVVRGVHQGNGHEPREGYAIFKVGAAVRQLELPLDCNPIPVPPWITRASAVCGVYEMEKSILLVVDLVEMLDPAHGPVPQNEPQCHIGANACR